MAYLQEQPLLVPWLQLYLSEPALVVNHVNLCKEFDCFVFLSMNLHTTKRTAVAHHKLISFVAVLPVLNGCTENRQEYSE